MEFCPNPECEKALITANVIKVKHKGKEVYRCRACQTELDDYLIRGIDPHKIAVYKSEETSTVSSGSSEALTEHLSLGKKKFAALF